MHRQPNKVWAKDRPGALPIPGDRSVSAFTKPNVLERWTEQAAGVRALEQGDAVITMFDVIGEDFWTGGGGPSMRSLTMRLKMDWPR